MSTVLDLISGSLTAIGQLGQGQTPNPEDGALGLRELNLMLAKESVRRLMIPYVGTREYALSAGVADYTIGPTGTFVAARPTLIESAQINVPGSSYWPPVSILDKNKWDAIPNRAAVDEVITSLFPQYTYPNLAFHVHPKPSGTPTVRLGVWEALTQFATLFDIISDLMPPQYEEYMESNLAVILAPYYDQPVPQNLMSRAMDAKAAVMELNAQSLGGSLSAAQKMESPNVGQPIPTGPPQQ